MTVGRKKDMVELRLRIPGEGWKELAALLTALLKGGAVPQNGEGAQETFVERGVSEGGSFAQAAFLRTAALETAEASSGEREQTQPLEQENAPMRYRAEGMAGGFVSAPGPLGGETEGAQARETQEGEAWERRMERDCRRFDSGFPLR